MPSSAPSPSLPCAIEDSRGRSNLVVVNGGRGVGGLNNARLVVAVGEGSGLKHNPGSSTYWTEAERAIFEEGVIEFASEPSIDHYATIAKKLPNKTIRDVAVRYQSLTVGFNQNAADLFIRPVTVVDNKTQTGKVKFYPEALRQMPTLQLYRFMLMLLNSLPTPSSK